MLNTESNLYQVIELEFCYGEEEEKDRKAILSYNIFGLFSLWMDHFFSSLKRKYFERKSICLNTIFSCKKSSFLAFVSVSDQVSDSEDTTQ